MVPATAVCEVLNQSGTTRSRTGGEYAYNLHVSDIIETTGVREFCAREHVFLYFSKREQSSGRLSPARKLLFASGHFLHSYVLEEFLQKSPLGKYTFGIWQCNDRDNEASEHIEVEDIYDNVINSKCTCGRKLNVYNEIEVSIPYLVGHPDLVLLVEGVYYIWEFKSYDRADLRFDDLTSALGAHRTQVSCYYKLLLVRAVKEGRKVSKRLVITYIDRSNSKLFGGQPYKSFSTEPLADKYLDGIKNCVSHFQKGVEDKVLPDRVCASITCRRARECPVAVECFERRSKYVGPRENTSGPKRLKTKVLNRV